MLFTQEDYRKIEDWLKRNAIKDTDMVPWERLDGTELIALVQNNTNKTMTFELLNGVFSDMGITHVPGIEDYEKFIRERVNSTLLEDRPVISENLNDSMNVDPKDLLTTIRYIEQDLSVAQKTRARQNIDAASQLDLDKMALERDKSYIQLQKDIESVAIMADPKVGNIAYVNADILADPITDPDKYYLVFSVNALDDKVNENLGKIGNLGDLKTAIKTSIVAAINEHQDLLGDEVLTTANKIITKAINELDGDIGNLANLETDTKDSLVKALNEICDKLNKDKIALITVKKDTIVNGINSLKTEVGEASDLSQTTTKTNCVEAINETNTNLGKLGELKTDEKNVLVKATNELHDELNSTNTTLTTVDTTDAYKGINSLKTEVGKAVDLQQTTTKADCTSAINEINALICDDEDETIDMDTEIFN